MTSVLDPKVHKRLIDEIDDIARTAGVPKRYIETSMVELCGDQEIEWVRGFREHIAKGCFGLVFVGDEEHTQQMMAMCGAFTRNFILSQVVTLNTLIEALKSGDAPDPTILFVPSFHRKQGKSSGGVSTFQANLLWGLLEDRMIQEKLTVIGVSSLDNLKSDYGPHFEQMVTNHYERVFL